jgi:hypothetical protein
MKLAEIISSFNFKILSEFGYNLRNFVITRKKFTKIIIQKRYLKTPAFATAGFQNPFKVLADSQQLTFTIL